MSLLTIVNNVNRLCPGLQPDLVKSYVQDSYLQLSRRDWNCLKLTHVLHTVAPYATGTVTVSAAGVVTVTTGVFASTMVGRFMRVYYKDSFFQIASYQAGAGTLTLTDWPGDVITDDTPYSIFQHIYSLDTSIGMVLEMSYQTALPKKGRAYFNSIDPSRITSGTPTWWGAAEPTAAGAIQVEVYPVPDAVYPIRVDARRKTSGVADTDPIFIPEDVVEAHALLTCFRTKAILQPQAGWEQRAAEQKVVFDDIMADALYDDYQQGSRPDHTKDKMFEPIYPESDTFKASHDVD